MQERKRTGLLVQSVARAAQIINCFRTARELGISEIAAEMDLNKSTVFGLVNTLVRYGYLEQTENKKYRLGITLFELGNLVLARIDIREETKKACAFLVQKYPATIHIATHSAGEVIYLDKIERGDSLISASNIGRRAPMYCTGVGKALLAHLPESYLKEYVLKGPLKKFTLNTISSKRELMKELERVHAAGYAMDREEIEQGLTCIAAPILQHDGEPVLAVSLSFPYGRIESVNQEDAVADILMCTKQLSARLGYLQ